MYHNTVLFTLFLCFALVYGRECPMKCLFLSDTQRKDVASCVCGGVEGSTMFCQWGIVVKPVLGSNGASLKSCSLGLGNPGECQPEEEGEISCTPSTVHGWYPMGPESFGNSEKFYCKGATSAYDFLPCWLYKCDDRLAVPSKTKANSVGAFLCHPPILYAEHQPKYCTLYSTTATQKIYSVLKPDEMDGCVLPPLCADSGSIDRTKYVPAFINGKEDDKYCEKLCPKKNNNAGKIGDQPCRRRPTCGGPNIFQVPECMEWCQPEVSQLGPDAADEKECNMRPMCVNGKAPTPYSDTNPFGATDKDCATVTSSNQTSNSSVNPSLISSSTEVTVTESTEDFFQKNWIWFTIGGVVLLLLGVVGGGLIGYKLCCARKEKKAEVEETEVEKEEDVEKEGEKKGETKKQLRKDYLRFRKEVEVLPDVLAKRKEEAQKKKEEEEAKESPYVQVQADAGQPKVLWTSTPDGWRSEELKGGSKDGKGSIKEKKGGSKELRKKKSKESKEKDSKEKDSKEMSKESPKHRRVYSNLVPSDDTISAMM